MKKYRDTFFRFYFNDKARLLSLCNALTGEDATDPNEIEINTLDETFFSKRKNDISCTFRGRLLILIEHQTTLNENMPLRFLLYFVKLLNKLYDKEFSRQIYNLKAIELPRPEFYVFYNGRESAPAFSEMKLSNSFKEPTDSLELKVKFYNLNPPHNRELLKKSLPLDDYCAFVERVALNKRNGLELDAAFFEAYKHFIAARAWMKDFLLEHEWELFDMIITEYNEEWDNDAKRIYYIEQGIERGIEQGRVKEKLSLVKNLLTTNLPITEIARVVGWSEEKILELAKTDSETYGVKFHDD